MSKQREAPTVKTDHIINTNTSLNNSMPQYRYHILNTRGEHIESNLPNRSHAEAVINHLKDTDPCNPYTIVEEQIFSKESTRLGRDPDLH